MDDADDSLSLKLLADIKAVWPEGEEKLDTASLLKKLKALDESPWFAAGDGKAEFELSPRRLAKMLRPFGVEARTIRIEERVFRGYEYDGLKSALSRYLEGQSATSATPQ